MALKGKISKSVRLERFVINPAIARLQRAVIACPDAKAYILRKWAESGFVCGRGDCAANFVAPGIGQYVPREGIFMDVWPLLNHTGEPTGIECQVYAAKQDLKDILGTREGLNYPDTVEAVGSIRDYEGHDGGVFPSSVEVVEFFKQKAEDAVLAGGNSFRRGEWFKPAGIDVWFVPPHDLLNGATDYSRRNPRPIHSENMFRRRNTGAFSGTFAEGRDDEDALCRYWSSTSDTDRDGQHYFANINFRRGFRSFTRGPNTLFSCRPVRVSKIRISANSRLEK
jgi:hypothetical protein